MVMRKVIPTDIIQDGDYLLSSDLNARGTPVVHIIGQRVSDMLMFSRGEILEFLRPSTNNEAEKASYTHKALMTTKKGNAE